jgi:hypothetical protein
MGKRTRERRAARKKPDTIIGEGSFFSNGFSLAVVACYPTSACPPLLQFCIDKENGEKVSVALLLSEADELANSIKRVIRRPPPRLTLVNKLYKKNDGDAELAEDEGLLRVD